ncbi:HAD-IA family hydrolase [Sulfitobacter aestuarii]|uniref:HAD-IA family hydrolase n=1 Tax=Sulfitobacter aestuarii TaxID=2161676 RepID=A0ABW5TWR1_9RHOB
MSAPLRLVIFDVDGTLVDSQGDIVAAMGAAFAAVGLPAPKREAVLSIVGLSLDVAVPRLAAGGSAADHALMVQGYKDAYMGLRAQSGVAASSPLYPGALDCLERLHAMPDVLLGIATGKSKRGLDKLIEGHGLEHFFITRQVADFHPSKPHPSMILEAMRETGVAPEHTLMLGDTSYDMEMAAAAGVRGVGVSWGYHPKEQLCRADHLIDDFASLSGLIEEMWSLGA